MTTARRNLIALSVFLLFGSAAITVANQTPAIPDQASDSFGKGALPPDTIGLTLPRVRHSAMPRYTVAGMRAKLQGDVSIDMVVELDGSVREVRVAKLPALNPLQNPNQVQKGFEEQIKELEGQALKTAVTWTFEPGSLNGQAVRVLLNEALEFRLFPKLATSR